MTESLIFNAAKSNFSKLDQHATGVALKVDKERSVCSFSVRYANLARMQCLFR